MRTALEPCKMIGAAALAMLSLCSVVMAAGVTCTAPSSTPDGGVFVDDGAGIYGYSLGGASLGCVSNASGAVTGAVFTYSDGLQPLLLTAASSAIYSYTLAGVKNTFATVSHPSGLAINSSGDVFTGASFGETLEEFGPAGGAGTQIATNLSVDSLAVNASGVVFEADDTGTSSNAINEFTYNGSAWGETTFVSLPSTDDQFYGMAFDSSGDLYVTYVNNSGMGGVLEFDPNGTQHTLLSLSSIIPVSLAYDPLDGSLFMGYKPTSTSLTGGIDVFDAVQNGVQTQGTGLDTQSCASAGTVCTTANSFASDPNGVPYGLAILAPEPGTLLTLGFGLIGVAFLGRRRVRQ